MRTTLTLLTMLALGASQPALAQPPLEQKASRAVTTARELRGLSRSMSSRLAFWRDRAIATPDNKAAINVITGFLKASARLGHGVNAVHLDDNLVVTDRGNIRFLNKGETSGVRARQVAETSSAKVVEKIHSIAKQIQKGEQVRSSHIKSAGAESIGYITTSQGDD